MRTAGDYRAEAERLRELANTVTDQTLLSAIAALIDELELYARGLENGAD